MRFVSLWKGPEVGDHVEDRTPGIAFSCTWRSVGLYALDSDGRAWTYCMRVTTTSQGKWLLWDDLMSGAAGRRTHAGGDE